LDVTIVDLCSCRLAEYFEKRFRRQHGADGLISTEPALLEKAAMENWFCGKNVRSSECPLWSADRRSGSN
jgi:hypothetical protein